MVRIVPAELVEPVKHRPNSAQLNPEAIQGLADALANEGEWVIWQGGFAHHKASKAQAFNLRHGHRQKILTDGLIDPKGDGFLQFKAWTDRSGPFPLYFVVARYTTAKFRVEEREDQ